MFFDFIESLITVGGLLHRFVVAIVNVVISQS